MDTPPPPRWIVRERGWGCNASSGHQVLGPHRRLHPSSILFEPRSLQRAVCGEDNRPGSRPPPAPGEPGPGLRPAPQLLAARPRSVSPETQAPSPTPLLCPAVCIRPHPADPSVHTFV